MNDIGEGRAKVLSKHPLLFNSRLEFDIGGDHGLQSRDRGRVQLLIDISDDQLVGDSHGDLRAEASLGAPSAP